MDMVISLSQGTQAVAVLRQGRHQRRASAVKLWHFRHRLQWMCVFEAVCNGTFIQHIAGSSSAVVNRCGKPSKQVSLECRGTSSLLCWFKEIIVRKVNVRFAFLHLCFCGIQCCVSDGLVLLLLAHDAVEQDLVCRAVRGLLESQSAHALLFLLHCLCNLLHSLPQDGAVVGCLLLFPRQQHLLLSLELLDPSLGNLL